MSTKLMCSSCHGGGKCEFCGGRGSLRKPHGNGQIIEYETSVCGVCFGSGLCPSCVPDAGILMVNAAVSSPSKRLVG